MADPNYHQIIAYGTAALGLAVLGLVVYGHHLTDKWFRDNKKEIITRFHSELKKDNNNLEEKIEN